MRVEEAVFREASGRAKTLLLLALVAMALWLLASAAIVFVMTALGVGSCSSSDACSERAAIALVGSLGVHAVAVGVAVFLVFRRMATLPRVLLLVLLALAVPTGTFVGSFLAVGA